ncbi:MAG: TIGR01777 family oxidoreductase, partial [Paludibacter sp.]|nr:TIGR01777 family oxidoreductase [Paludibacter sp.]
MKKVVIAGGTGFIGSYLAKRFIETGYQVLIISRDPHYISWKPIDLIESFEDAELVINLAGKSINCPHSEENKKAILDSRINTTIWIGNAILACKNPPRLWINGSACGIYKPSLEHAMTEDETKLGTDFLSDVVRQWEKVFFGFKLNKTRKVALRTSVVLGKKGGALLPLTWLTRFGLGGRQAKGTQMFSWIHEEDYFRILLYLIENNSLQGIVNCTSPEPVTNKRLMNSLRKTLRMPIGIPAPEFVINLGAKIIGTEPELI